MAFDRCPGQDRRFWRVDDIFESPCPECGRAIEFWRGDVRVLCRSCGRKVVNPRLNLACAAWCKWGDKCLEGLTLEDRLTVAVREWFRGDDARLDRALQSLDDARRIQAAEGGDAGVVAAAALLRDGADEHGMDAARAALKTAGLEDDAIERACQTLADSRVDGTGLSLEAAIVHDALALRRWSGSEAVDAGSLETRINRIFRTDMGRRLAKAQTLRGRNEE